MDTPNWVPHLLDLP